MLGNNQYKKITIEDVKELALIRGGECISSIYINAKTSLSFKCKYGHIWNTSYDCFKNHWCQMCAAENRKKPNKIIKLKKTKIIPSIYRIEDAQKIANERGGLCLSQEYKNFYSHLEWKCKEGHSWSASFGHTKSGSWCPECSINTSVSENICREILNKLFETEFIKARPIWLKNDKNKWLELDGFSEKLNIAFEHQGKQHYQLGRFVKTQQQLDIIKNNDKIKLNICNDRGIKLIIIPQINIYDINGTKDKIVEYCNNLNLNIKNINPILNISKFYICDRYFKKYTIDFFKNLAINKTGECLSDVYNNTAQKLSFLCKKHNFIWNVAAHHILNGSWCEKCQYENSSYSLEEMEIFAQRHNAHCISEKYNGLYSNLEWKCSENHRFLSSFSNIKKRKNFCPVCHPHHNQKLQNNIVI